MVPRPIIEVVITCKRAIKRHQRVTLRYGGAVGAGGSLRSPNYRCACGATWTHSRIVPSVSPSTSSRMDADRTMIARETRPGSSESSRGELRFLPAGARTQKSRSRCMRASSTLQHGFASGVYGRRVPETTSPIVCCQTPRTFGRIWCSMTPRMRMRECSSRYFGDVKKVAIDRRIAW